jgi:hypothetical protein
VETIRRPPRIAELERRLAEANEARQAPNLGPPPPHHGFAQEPQAFSAPPPYPGMAQGPQAFSAPSPYPGDWRGRSSFGRRRRRSFLWLLLLPFLLLWPVVKHPVLNFVQRSVDRESTTSVPAVPRACDLLTPDIVKPVLGADATVTQDTRAFCGYTSSSGYGRVEVGSWSRIKPLGFDQRPVSGLGDEALFSASELYVRKGSVGLRIDLAAGLFSGGPAADPETRQDEAEKAIAEQLLPKL